MGNTRKALKLSNSTTDISDERSCTLGVVSFLRNHQQNKTLL